MLSRAEHQRAKLDTFTPGGVGRWFAKEAKPRVSRGRPRNFVFRYQPQERSFNLALQFRKSQVERDEIIQALRRIIDEWSAYAEERPGLVYEARDDGDFALLTTTAPDLDQDGFPTMWSLRNVDAVSNLYFAPGLW